MRPVDRKKCLRLASKACIKIVRWRNWATDKCQSTWTCDERRHKAPICTSRRNSETEIEWRARKVFSRLEECAKLPVLMNNWSFGCLRAEVWEKLAIIDFKAKSCESTISRNFQQTWLSWEKLIRGLHEKACEALILVMGCALCSKNFNCAEKRWRICFDGLQKVE